MSSRNSEVSNAICGRPGLSEAIAASISWLTASTFAPGAFCTTSTSAGAPFSSPAPASGGLPWTRVATLPRLSPVAPETGSPAMFFGVPNGRTGWMVIRCSMSSMNPAVPGVLPCR